MPEQKFNLLQFAAAFPAQLAQGRWRSWAPKCSIPICFDDCQLPTRPPVAQSVAINLSRLRDRAQQSVVFDAGHPHPGVDALLHPDGDGDGADARLFPRGQPGPNVLPFAEVSRCQAQPTRSAAERSRPTVPGSRSLAFPSRSTGPERPVAPWSAHGSASSPAEFPSG